MLRTYARCGPERDPRSLHMIDAHGKPTVYDLRSDIERQLAATAKTGLALLAVERCDGDGFIGCCGLIVGRASWDEPEIAFEMFRRAHGHGYATEAREAIVATAAETGRAHLWSTVRAWNRPSLRVLEKLRFVQSGQVTPGAERGDLVWLAHDLASRNVSAALAR